MSKLMQDTSKNNVNIEVISGVLWLVSPEGKKIFWDINSFRPNLQEKLEDSKKYKADVIFDEENRYDGVIIQFPRIITIHLDKGKKSFVNVR